MPGTNQMRSYTAVVFVSMLVLVSGQCTKTYSGFKQCTILNGATHRTCPASGGCGMCASEMVQQKYHCDIDSITEANYLGSVKSKLILNSTTCKTVFYAYSCIYMAINMGEDPCDASGAPMLPCYDLCTAYHACATIASTMATEFGSMTVAEISAGACDILADPKLKASAAKGAACFGTAGNKGMASPASGATSLTVSSYITVLASTVVAFVIVAAA